MRQAATAAAALLALALGAGQAPRAAASPAQITPLALGAKGDGVADDRAALQAALDAGAGAAAPVRIPRGVFALSGSLVLHSHTTVVCEAGAVLKQTTADTVFVNANGARDWRTDLTPAVPENMTDTDLSVSGCTLDFTQAGTAQVGPPGVGPGGFAFLLAQRLRIVDNRMIGGDRPGRIGNMIRVSKAYDVEVARNSGTNLYNGFGFWGGGGRVTAHDNAWRLAVNTFNPSPFSCSNINGMGGAEGDHETIRDVTYERNACYVQGAVAPYLVVEYNYDALSSGSRIVNLKFADNKTVGQGANIVCFSAKGDITGLKILGNSFETCEGPALFLGARATPWGEKPRALQTTAQSSAVRVGLAGASAKTVSPGNMLDIAPPTTVGGLTLSGKYPVRAVAADEVTIDAGKPAKASQALEARARIVTFWGVVRNSVVENNTFKGVKAPGDGAIVVEGPGNVVRDNAVMSGDYGALTLTSSRDCCSKAPPAPVRLSGNHGPAGGGVTRPTGGFAVSGDGASAYETGYAPKRAP